MKTKRSRLRLLAGALAVLPASSALASTLAHYRFENPPPANPQDASIIDSSENGSHLKVYRNPALVVDVPGSLIPRTETLNTQSLRFSGTEYGYSLAETALGRVPLDAFTLEAWVKFSSLSGWQTFVGRDDQGNPGLAEGPQSLFYFSKTIDSNPPAAHTANGFRVELVNRSNEHLMINSDAMAEVDTWYHVAAVGDAATGLLSLYVNGSLVGSTTGFNGLFVPAQNTAWTIGRGQYTGRSMDFFRGCIDEVRFSDTALTPADFLNSLPPPPPPPVVIAPPEPAPAPEASAPPPKKRGFWKRFLQIE